MSVSILCDYYILSGSLFYQAKPQPDPPYSPGYAPADQSDDLPPPEYDTGVVGVMATDGVKQLAPALILQPLRPFCRWPSQTNSLAC